MRLLTPSAGEAFDRLLILELKIKHAPAGGLPTAHFEKEKLALTEYLAGKFDLTAHDPTLAATIMQLRSTNEHLWELTNALRAAAGFGTLAEVAPVAVMILDWNDSRAKLVEQINKHLGDYDGPEKI